MKVNAYKALKENPKGKEAKRLYEKQEAKRRKQIRANKRREW